MTSHDQRPISRLAHPWPAVPYDEWSATGDTLHMHTQALGKLAVALAPQQWQLGHAALRLTARRVGDRPLAGARPLGARSWPLSTSTLTKPWWSTATAAPAASR